MALGVDLYAAEIVLNLKAKYPHITLESAIPCETQAVKWSVAARERYYNIAAKCDKETMLQREYTSDCKAFWNHRHCRWFSLYKKPRGAPSGAPRGGCSIASQWKAEVTGGKSNRVCHVNIKPIRKRNSFASLRLYICSIFSSEPALYLSMIQTARKNKIPRKHSSTAFSK